MITLRPYQQDAVASLRASIAAGHRRPLLVAPTGAGKTVMFSAMVARTASLGKRATILVHRSELIDQVSETLQRFDVPHGIIAPKYTHDMRHQVQVASVFALARRLDRTLCPDVLIIDEAHHAILDSTWGKVIDTWAASIAIGVTATPERLSGEGLGQTFDDLILGPGTGDLIRMGMLSPYRMFAPPSAAGEGLHSRAGDYIRSELEDAYDRPTITGDVIEHYQRLAMGKRAVAFCVSVAHAEHVAELFRAAGIASASIDGTMERDERRQRIADFTAGRILVLTSCDLISEGFDCPAIEVAILIRKTQSLALYLQQVGRALRLFQGKTEALIIDHVGNCMMHGLPDDPRDWSLDGRKRRAKPDDESIEILQCPKCYRIMMRGVRVCECGFCFADAPKRERVIEQVDGELAEVNREQMAARRELGQARTREALSLLASERGYKAGYVDHVEQARQEKQRLREELTQWRRLLGIPLAGLYDLKPKALRLEIEALKLEREKRNAVHGESPAADAIA